MNFILTCFKYILQYAYICILTYFHCSCFTAMRKHMLHPIEVYINKAKEKDHLALPNNNNTKGYN